MFKAVTFLIIFKLVVASAFADEVKVGVINLKPWASVSENRQLSGQHIDFFDELSKRSGLSFKYSILSLQRLKDNLKTGKIDMSVIFKRDAMAPYVDFLGLVMPYNYYLVGRQGDLFNDKTVRELGKVGYVEGQIDVATKCFSNQYNPTAKMFPAPNFGNLLKMLNAGRIEGATIPSKGLKAYLDEIGKDETFINQLFLLCKNEAHLQVSKKSDVLNEKGIQILRQSLIDMHNDGTIQRIAGKYAELNK